MAIDNNRDAANFTAGPSGLPKPQKIAVSVLGVFAILILSFWIWQMRAQIRQPFTFETDEPAASGSASDVETLLRKQDTDKDGLSDYDEIYVHSTSPYLEDSDSDNLSDRDEVSTGSDPNCPQGKSCDLELTVPSAATTTATTSAPSIGGGEMNEAELQQILSGEIDGATLRQLLITSGAATAADLAPVSDEELLKSYQEALKNQSQ